MLTKVNIDGYIYTYNPTTEELVLTQYVGSDVDIATPVIETENKCIITINPTPADATVVITAAGFEPEGNTIIVDPGTELTYTVSKYGYTSQSDTFIVNENATIDVTLEPILFTLTINPHPRSAEVILRAEGYNQVDNSITVLYGTEVRYRVSKLGYNAQAGSIVVTHDETLNIKLSLGKGSMGMLYNYGSCVVCFISSMKVMDLGKVSLPEVNDLDLGFTKDDFNEEMDLGIIEAEE